MLKEGDIVRIKTVEEMLEDKNVYEDYLRNLEYNSSSIIFVEEMRKYCDKTITVTNCNSDTFNYRGWIFVPWMYEILEQDEKLTQNCHMENEENKSKQEKNEDKNDENSDKTPILSDGDIIKDKEGNVGIVLNNYIRYSKCSTLINTDNISKIYKVKENNTCGYKDILNPFEIDRYCDVIWERLEIEQSLDELEIGTKVKVKNKLLNITETLTVGRFNSNKVLIRDGLTCYNFNSDKYEILEIIK